MNLYKHIFTHYSQDSSDSGMRDYFIAENDEKCFEYLKSEFENDDEDLTEEEYKNRIIKDGGNWEDDLDDLYYGRTLNGWELFKENITDLQIEVLKELKII